MRHRTMETRIVTTWRNRNMHVRKTLFRAVSDRFGFLGTLCNGLHVFPHAFRATMDTGCGLDLHLISSHVEPAW